MVTALVLMLAAPAMADDDEFLVVVTALEDGSDRNVQRELSEIPGVRVQSHEWFARQVESRAFRVDRVLNDLDDLEWVMEGAGIDLVITFEERDESDYRVRLIRAENVRSPIEFLADRGHDGAIRRGGAMVIRYELEELLDVRPDARAAAPAPAEVDEEDEVGAMDPESLRQRAAAEHRARREELSRNWLWVRGFGRFQQKDFTVAVYGHENIDDAVYSFQSGGMPGVSLEVEAFPFGRNDPDEFSAGFYGRYDHAFHGLTITLPDETRIEVPINDISMEFGALYRIDTPLDEDRRQIRLKVGMRYDLYSVSDDIVVPSTSMLSPVLGTRLVIPIAIPEFAIVSNLDVMPIAMFQRNNEIFGKDSFSWGFGADVGLQFEIFANGTISLGYDFQFFRSYFDDEGEVLDEAGGDLPVFEEAFFNAEVYDFSHGLRVGFIFHY